jgi:hypothetical protein
MVCYIMRPTAMGLGGGLQRSPGLPRGCGRRGGAIERGQTGAPIRLGARTSPASAKEGGAVKGGPVRATQ